MKPAAAWTVKYDDARAIPAHYVTVACDVDRHELCRGTAELENGHKVKCGCRCHPRPTT